MAPNIRPFISWKSAWCFVWIAILFPLIEQVRCEPNKLVKAESGDGVYRLLKRHGLSREEHFDAFVELNRDNLGPKNTLYKGRIYKLPEISRFRSEPLFGEKYQTVELVDHRLAGAVFYLISGHGGPDPGGIGKDGNHTLYEDEYAYDVTLRLARRLMEHNARVYIIIRDPNSGIRDGRYLSQSRNEVCYPNQQIPLNQTARLKQRTDAVNRLHRDKDTGARYKRCISIHVDARRKQEKIDVFFYHHKNSRNGKRLADTMCETMQEKYRLNQPGRGYEGTVAPRNLYIVREILSPVVFVEIGNIHNKRDQVRLTEPNNRQAIANWLSEGILRDFEGN